MVNGLVNKIPRFSYLHGCLTYDRIKPVNPSNFFTSVCRFLPKVTLQFDQYALWW
jgi:hypothetical protein